MRKVALTIQNGAEAGRILWVRLDQVIEVGSSDSVDFAVVSDSQMEPLHFEIRHHRYGCFVEALSENAVFKVNHQDAQRKRLHDGDILLAGGTTFVADIQDDSHNGSLAKMQSQIDTVTAADLAPEKTSDSDPPTDSVNDTQETDFAVAHPSTASVGITPSDIQLPVDSDDEEAGESDDLVGEQRSNRGYYAQDLAADAKLYQPHYPEHFSVLDLVNGLSANLDVYCVVDKRFQTDEGIADEYDIDAARKLVAFETNEAASSALDLETTAILIVANAATEELLNAVRAEQFSFGQPNVFSTQAAMGTKSMVENLLKHKKAVLIADQHVGWQLFAAKDLNEGWEEFGFDGPPGTA